MEKETDETKFLQGRMFELRALDALPGQVEQRLEELTRYEKEADERKKQDARAGVHQRG